jgi:hypothetical protein
MTRELARLAVTWPDLGCSADLGVLAKRPKTRQLPQILMLFAKSPQVVRPSTNSN